ncbi:MAG TPA: 3-hydroxyacyl-CoA dehydrogenase NAD-binding domain-containing protein [Polyangiaceae bacterium]|jgi:carnitine 3-dehydrogenase|nr:3-hydroxyacyl-CoA dehydrogenase NAD-binding domain-containing protein [Polyangiaceae bacterium]
MKKDSEVRRAAIVGTGVIGASWAACFLAHGLDVVATDPAPGAEQALFKYVEAAWPALRTLGLSAGASIDRLKFTTELKQAVSDADLVQENGPEREALKVKLFAEIDANTPPSALLASSSSGLTMSRIQSECAHAERTVIGHPFTPPHLIPLVEVVGGVKTSPKTVERALAFYAKMGRRPIHIKKEVKGHVANRLQAALYREIVYLIEQDVVSVADIDAAVHLGPGLRWGLMGPNLLFHLGGGANGFAHFLEQFTAPMMAWWADLGNPDLASPALREKLKRGVLEEVSGQSVVTLAQERDRLLIGLLQLLDGSRHG